METFELHVNTCGFFYDDSRITVPMELKSAMCLVKILFKRTTFRVLLEFEMYKKFEKLETKKKKLKK